MVLLYYAIWHIYDEWRLHVWEKIEYDIGDFIIASLIKQSFRVLRAQNPIDCIDPDKDVKQFLSCSKSNYRDLEKNEFGHQVSTHIITSVAFRFFHYGQNAS